MTYQYICLECGNTAFGEIRCPDCIEKLFDDETEVIGMTDDSLMDGWDNDPQGDAEVTERLETETKVIARTPEKEWVGRVVQMWKRLEREPAYTPVKLSPRPDFVLTAAQLHGNNALLTSMVKSGMTSLEAVEALAEGLQTDLAKERAELAARDIALATLKTR